MHSGVENRVIGTKIGICFGSHLRNRQIKETFVCLRNRPLLVCRNRRLHRRSFYPEYDVALRTRVRACEDAEIVRSRNRDLCCAARLTPDHCKDGCVRGCGRAVDAQISVEMEGLDVHILHAACECRDNDHDRHNRNYPHHDLDSPCATRGHGY